MSGDGPLSVGLLPPRYLVREVANETEPIPLTLSLSKGGRQRDSCPSPEHANTSEENRHGTVRKG